MKSLVILFVGVAALSISSCSQNIPGNKIPSVVQNALKAKFASASHIEWEWEKKDRLFEAEFYLDNKEYTALIDSTGQLIMHKIDIQVSELPDAVISTVRQSYSDYKIDDAEKLEKEGITYYVVGLERKGEKDKRLVFSKNGSLEDNMRYIN